jgi:hypothetical protein
VAGAVEAAVADPSGRGKGDVVERVADVVAVVVVVDCAVITPGNIRPKKRTRI